MNGRNVPIRFGAQGNFLCEKFKGILFDFDGVIGRTMEDNYTAWKNVLSQFGIELDKR